MRGAGISPGNLKQPQKKSRDSFTLPNMFLQISLGGFSVHVDDDDVWRHRSHHEFLDRSLSMDTEDQMAAYHR